MQMGRTLPPAAAPLTLGDIVNGVGGLARGSRELERFRAELQGYFDVEQCFLVSSGKAAFTIILRSLHELYPDRNEVLIPAFTCYSVPASIMRAGLRVRLCDLDPRTLDFEETALRTALDSSNRLLAVVPTHLFGIPSRIDRVRALVGDRQVVVIEDAAQAMGGEYRGNKLGTLGDVGVVSLDRGKAFSTVAGGIILTQNQVIARQVAGHIDGLPSLSRKELLQLVIKALVISIFQHPSLFWIPKSLPFLQLGQTLYEPGFPMLRFSPFQAGLARGWKRRLAYFQKCRRENLRQFLSLGRVILDKIPRGVSGNIDLIRLPIIVEDRDTRQRLLKDGESRGLGITQTYPRAINGIYELKAYFDNTSYPGAEKISETLVTLPIHPFITMDDIRKIGNCI